MCAETAINYADACGRDVAGAKDVKNALKYQAMVFFDSEFQDDYALKFQEESTHTYLTEDEDSSGEEEEEGEEEGGEEGGGGGGLQHRIHTRRP